MIDLSSLEPDPLNALAEEFLKRYRAGERPALSEYLARFPEHAVRIRELFPALALMEQLGPTTHETPIPSGAQAPCSWGEFRLLREVGRGGMGIVYEAVQQSLGRRVALKVLPPALCHGTPRERFEREARAAARLHHTNIVPVFGIGTHDGTPFYVMQFIDGRGLDAVLANRKAADSTEQCTTRDYYRQTALLGVQAADALAHAHAQGVLHRDIKPSNLMLDCQGTLWVTDFGLAKADDSDTLTAQGDVVGTLRYLAPERFRGQCDARSDVYALGVTLYELLTHRPAFNEEDRHLLMERIARHEPVRPRQLAPALPKDLETIVLKAIAPDPASRYQNAAALAEDLRRFLADRPILARRASLPEGLRRWRRRNPVVATLSGAVALLLVLLALGSTLAALSLRRTAEEARQAEHVAIERLLDSSMAQARALRTSGHIGQQLETWKVLEQAVESARSLGKRPAELIALRNEAIASLALPDMRLEQQWEGNPPGTSGLGFDPHFELYAWSFKDEGIRVLRTSDHQELLRLPPLREPRAYRWIGLSFSASGRFLAAHYKDDGPPPVPLQIWDLKNQPRRPPLTIPDCGHMPTFSPDERILAVCQKDRTIAFYDLETGQESKRLPSSIKPDNLSFSPDGRKLAVASIVDQFVQIRDFASGTVERYVSFPAGVWSLAWHPNGRTLAIGDIERRIYLWDSQKEDAPIALEGHTWGVNDLAFDSSGDRLLSFGWDMTFRLWDTQARRLLLTLSDVRTAGFRRDGRLMAAALRREQVQLWDVVANDVLRVFRGFSKPVFEPKISPDSRLACASDGEEIRLLDIATARELARLPPIKPQPNTDPTEVATLTLLWEPTGEGLLSRGKSGLYRWPVRYRDEQGRAAPRIGPPRLLPKPGGESDFGHMLQCGPQGGLLALSNRSKGSISVFRLDDPLVLLWQRPILNVTSLRGSPDGRWLASGTLNGEHPACVWDAQTGRLEKELPLGAASVDFSPDGRWLATGTGRFSPTGADCRTWHVGSWEQGRRIPIERSSSTAAVLCYSPDGSMLAVVNAMEEVRLLHPETLEDLATLVSPVPLLITGMVFSPDSSQLAVTANNRIHLWDLRTIRRRLRELDLDWDAPAYPPPPDPLPRVPWTVDLN